eukprot:m.192743 g.192743  ORF g.192743 m.192743 type:complete len:71 (+) comp14864_c0_seq2:141-353(+)
MLHCKGVKLCAQFYKWLQPYQLLFLEMGSSGQLGDVHLEYKWIVNAIHISLSLEPHVCIVCSSNTKSLYH